LQGEVVASGSLRVRNRFLGDVGMDVLFSGELFVQVEPAGHLEDVLLSMVLRFRGFKQCHEGTVGAQCRSGAEGRSVGKWMIRDGLSVFLLVSDEGQCLVVGICLGPLWDRVVILCLLRPMMGQ
jgi:hypothetical protein